MNFINMWVPLTCQAVSLSSWTERWGKSPYSVCSLRREKKLNGSDELEIYSYDLRGKKGAGSPEGGYWEQTQLNGWQGGLCRKVQSKGHWGPDLQGEQSQAGEECPGEVNQGAGSLRWETEWQAKHSEGEDGLYERNLERWRGSRSHGNLQALFCQQL